MPGSEPLKSVIRAMDVLEMVGHSLYGLQLKELRRALGQNPATMHTLLRTLVDRRYLVKIKSPIRYILGPAAKTMDRQAIDNGRLGQIGQLMTSICQQTGMRITLQKLMGYRVFVLLHIRPETILHLERQDWISASYGTSIIFQAYQTKKEQDIYWRENPMGDFARKLWGNFGNLRKYLKLAAEQKLAIIDTKYDHKLRISAPIFDADGKMVEAIGAFQSCDKITPQQAKLAVQLIYSAGRMLSAPIRDSTAAKTQSGRS